MARSVLLNLLGNEAGAVRALRNVGDEADRTADRVDRLDGAGRNAGDGQSVLAGVLARVAPAAGQAAASIGTMTAGLGAAVPAAAGLAATLAQIAPAAGVAATGLIAAGLAGTALKIGMAGVNDAIGAAFDPAKATEFAEAMAKLTPNAREFVTALQDLKPALDGIKASVQDRLFEGIAEPLKEAAASTLPQFKAALTETAGVLNAMGKEVLRTATDLSESGALGQALKSATTGLGGFSRLPATIVQGLVQIAAAAGPSFERLGSAAEGGIQRLSDMLTRGFESGGMERAINAAVESLKQLWEVGKNVGEIFANIFGAAQTSGGGLIGVLQTITSELAKVTASAEVQGGLKAIFETMSMLARTVAPLLGQALQQLGPVFAALGPPVQTLIQALGAALQPVIAALGPVLAAAATAVGQLVTSLAPLLPVVGTLVAGLLPALTPILQVITEVFAALAPVVEELATALTGALQPVLAVLPGLVEPIARIMGQLALAVLPILADLIRQLAPVLQDLGQRFADLLVQAQPLITMLADQFAAALEALAPLIPPIISVIVELASVFTETLAGGIEGVVLPAIRLFTALLSGDGEAAITAFADLAEGAVKATIEMFVLLPARIGKALADLAPEMADAASRAFTRFNLALGRGIVEAVNEVAMLPLKIVSALGRGLGNLLYGAGASVIAGFVAGIRSMIPSVSGVLGSITSMIPKWKGPMPKDRVLLTESGEAIMAGLVDGIAKGVAPLEETLGRVTETIAKGIVGARDAVIKVSAEIRDGLLGDANQIDAATKKIAESIRAAFKDGDIGKGARDGLLDYLAESNKNLKSLTEQRMAILDKIKEARDFAKRMTEEALNFASIVNIKGTDGNAPDGAAILAGLQGRLAQIRAFAGNIKKLGEAGLSRTILAQILDAGIDGGAAIAAELANGPNSIIVALNSTQKAIDKISKKLGLDTADLLFDSGKNAGDGFLKGLQSTEKALLAAMKAIVKKLIDELDDGIAKLKTKAAEGQTLAAGYVPPGGFKPPAPAPPAAPKQSAPKAAASYSGGGSGGLGSKTVNVNMGGVRVSGMDVDAFTNRVGFAARSTAF